MPSDTRRDVRFPFRASPCSRHRAGTIAGGLSISVYLSLIVAIALDPAIHPAKLGSSPAGVAAGKSPQLLSSGLVIDGPTYPQIALIAGVLCLALRRLGAISVWRIGLGAHVGATLVAYLGIWLVWLVDSGLVRHVTHAPD